MTNQLLENYIKNQLILAIGTTGILGTKIGKNTRLNPNETAAIVKTAKEIKNNKKLNPNRISKGVKDSFTRRINNNDFSQFTDKEISDIKSFIGIEDSDINQENLENPLVLLFQELLSNSENISDDDREDMSLNKDAIESDLGIDKFDNLEKWSESVLLGTNDDVIGLFRQPIKINHIEDENDLFSQIGVYEIDPTERKRIKESIQEKINFLRTQGANDKIVNLMSALGSLKINGVLDGSDVNSDFIERTKSLLQTEDMQEVLSKYISNTAAAFTEFDDSDYEENLDY